MPNIIPYRGGGGYYKGFDDAQAAQSRNVLNRINQMKAQDYERRAVKEQGMNVLAQQYATPAQPQQVMPEGMAGPPMGATPASFDEQGYTNKLMGMYPQEGMKAQRGIQEREQAEMDTVLGLAKQSPEMAEKRWNMSPLGKKYGQIKFKETKDNLHFFNNEKTGEISSVDKGTGEFKIIKKGRERVPNKMELEIRASRGDQEASRILGQMTSRAIKEKRAGKPETTINIGAGKISKIDPESYTPASVSAFEKSGDYTKLMPIKKESKEEGRGRVTTTLTELRGLYDELSEMGSIIDVKEGTFDNILAAAQASSLGQFTGRVIGSKAQSTRNRINSIRPLLIQDMRKASEMGARGLDSEKELEFYLQAATDPKRDLQSNIAAINVLNAAYGLGDKVLSQEERQAKEMALEQARAEALKVGVSSEKRLRYNPETGRIE